MAFEGDNLGKRCMFIAGLVGNAMILPAMLVTLRYPRMCRVFVPLMGVGFGGAVAIGIFSYGDSDHLRAGYYVWTAAFAVSVVGSVWGCFHRPPAGPRGFEVIPVK
jgi:hypothetical protein